MKEYFRVVGLRIQERLAWRTSFPPMRLLRFRRLGIQRDDAIRLLQIEQRLLVAAARSSGPCKVFHDNAAHLALLNLVSVSAVTWAARLIASGGCVDHALRLLAGDVPANAEDADAIARITAEIHLRRRNSGAAVNEVQRLGDMGHWRNARTVARSALFTASLVNPGSAEARGTLVAALSHLLRIDDARLLFMTAMLQHELGMAEVATRTLTRARPMAHLDREGFVECLAWMGRKEEALRVLAWIAETDQAASTVELADSPFVESLSDTAAWDVFQRLMRPTPDQVRLNSARITSALQQLGLMPVSSAPRDSAVVFHIR